MTLIILEGYGVFPSVHQFLAVYWYRSVMAKRASGYYGEPFLGSCGVTQGDPLSPIIFNIILMQ